LARSMSDIGILYRTDINVIVAVVATVAYPDYRAELEAYLEEVSKYGYGNLVKTIGRVLDGERDKDELCATLDLTGSGIIHTILASIENHDTLKELLAEQPDYAQRFRLRHKKVVLNYE
jgi:hypothetical protein